MSRLPPTAPRNGPVCRASLPALAGLLLSVALPTLALEIDARLSDTAIRSNETVTLILEMQGRTSARPDLSVLTKDFRILDRRSQSSISIVNGQRSERNQLILTLAPQRAGALQIPAITIGDSATEPLQLSVADTPERTSDTSTPSYPAQSDSVEIQPRPADDVPQANSGVLLKASIEPVRVRVREQAVLTAKVYMPARVLGPRLHDPKINSARILPLGEDRYGERRNGTDYSVYERRYALFPVVEGRLEIEPLVFEGWERSSSTSAYQPLGDAVKARSEALTLRVLPMPRDGTHETWLPARSLTLSETGPETYRVRTGQALERVISIRADGVMASDLPILKTDAPNELHTQRTQARLWNERRPEGVIGTRRESIRLSAGEPGHYRLPPLSVDWWDTDTKRWSTAVLAARELVVSPAPFADQSPSNGVASAGASGNESEPLMAARATDYPASSSDSNYVPRSAGSGSSLWLWITAGLGLAWLLTTGAWWLSCRRAQARSPAPMRHEPATEPTPPPDLESAPEADPLAASIEAVRTAYERGDAKAAQAALLAWGREVLPAKPPSNLARLAQRCKEPLRSEILTLEQAFFSPRPLHWERQPVSERLRQFEPAPEEEPASFRRPKPIRRRRAEPDASS